MLELLVKNGRGRGRRFSLVVPRTVIGRHPACDLVLDDAAVSRQHAVITIDGETAFIEDLRSRNGTRVNGRVVTGRQRLDDGDEVTICDQRLRFGAPEALSTGLRSQPATDLQEIVEAGSNDSLILSQVELGSLDRDAAASPGTDAALRAVIRLHRGLAEAVSLEDVLPRFLDGVLTIFPQADRGFVLLIDAASQRPVVRASRVRGVPEPGPLRLSLSLIEKVIGTKRAILSADAATDRRFSASESIADFRIRSVMCVPLLDNAGTLLGVVHIDSRDLGRRFAPADLEVLAGVAVDAGRVMGRAVAQARHVEQEQLKRDLELAHRVQQGLLPSTPPAVAGYDLFDFYEPAQHIGGDFFAYVPLVDGRIAVVLADVSGKGVSAALVMAALSSDVRYCLASEPDVARAVTQINGGFSRSGWDDRFATLIVAVLEPRSGRVTIVNAGHLPALLRDRTGGVRAVGAEEAGLPLGVDREHAYGSCIVDLVAGDALVLFTDGISEAMDVDHRCYGLERLERVLADSANNAEDIGRRILGDVERHTAGQARSDDICLVCIGRRGGPSEQSAQRPKAVRGGRGVQSGG